MPPVNAQLESRMVAGVNRRTNNRYSVNVTLEYRVAGSAPGSAPHARWKRGRTLDMSAGGILVGIGEEIPVGATLELVIAFPAMYYGRPIIRLHVTASVLRSDPRSAALLIITQQFRDIPLA